MNEPSSQEPKRNPPLFATFDELTRKLMSVPKSDIDNREAEYQRQQAEKPKRGPKPKPNPE